MTPQEIKPIVESLLFAAGAPVSLRRLAEVIGVAQAEIKPALVLLQADYAAPGRGIALAEVAGGYQLRTVADYVEYVKTLIREKPNRLSRAALETLAIIAYRQPITKAEIEVVRGVDADGVLNSLLTKKLIRVLGRKDVPGRPWVYGTTPQFLELFGLNDLNSLPPLPEIHEPTINPYSDFENTLLISDEDETRATAGSDASGAIAEDSEPSGDNLATSGGETDSGGTSESEWRNDHSPRDDGRSAE
jgi:segregation and condensation protein B